MGQGIDIKKSYYYLWITEILLILFKKYSNWDTESVVVSPTTENNLYKINE